MKNSHHGSCLCGEVKFQIEGAFDGFFLCHCKYCQKDTGSAHASNLVSSTAKLNWISGSTLVKTFNLKATRHMKSFCCECSSALPSLQMEGKMLVVPAGSLDSEVEIKPMGHIFYASKASWEDGLESIKKFDSFPS